MRYKNAGSSMGVHKRHPMLCDVLFFAETYSRERFSIEPTITASERSRQTSLDYYVGKEKDRNGNLYTAENVPISVHETTGGILRGTDLRAKVYTPIQQGELEKAINDKFIYDPIRVNKVVARCHSLANGAIHFHIQVHPNTRERGL